MKIILYFLSIMIILSAGLVFVLIILSAYTTSILASFTSYEKIYFLRFLLMRIYPILTNVSILIMSILISKKIFFNIYKKRGLFVLFFIITISTFLWGIYNEYYDFDWGDRISKQLSLVLFNDNAIEVRYNYNLDINDGEESWLLLWANDIGYVQEQLIIPDEEAHGEEHFLEEVSYSDNRSNLQVFAQGEAQMYFSESIVAFLKDPLFDRTYTSGISRILFFISISILLSINVLLLGIFQFQGETLISNLILYIIISMIFFLFLDNKYVMGVSAFFGVIFFVVLLIQSIRKTRG